MRIVTWVGLACLALMAVRPCAAAGLTLSVVQDPSSMVDLNNLQVGQTILFDVVLSGLDVTGGQALGSLEGTAVFSSTLLGTPTVPSPGAIIADSSGFLASSGSGSADASYVNVLSNSNTPITMNGTFFTFSVTVQPNVSGSGALSFDPNQGGFVAAFDTDFNVLSISAGPDLPFTVIGSSVPEPGALSMMSIALAAILGGCAVPPGEAPQGRAEGGLNGLIAARPSSSERRGRNKFRQFS